MSVSEDILEDFEGERKRSDLWVVRYVLPYVDYYPKKQVLSGSAWCQSEELDEKDIEVLEGKNKDRIAKEAFVRTLSPVTHKDFKTGAIRVVEISGALSGDYKNFIVTVVIKTNEISFSTDLKALGEFLDLHFDPEDSLLLLISIIDEFR
jgi:hypothetical protein